MLLQKEPALEPFARKGSLSRLHKSGLAAVAAVLLLAVMLYIQSDHHDPIPRQEETILTVFDADFNQQSAAIRQRIIELKRTKPVSEKGPSYKKLKNRIDYLKNKPIFRKENDHVEKSVRNDFCRPLTSGRYTTHVKKRMYVCKVDGCDHTTGDVEVAQRHVLDLHLPFLQPQHARVE